MVKKKEQGTSKKSEQKKKQKVLEDKTFGLKNKNKSKKVQQHIQSVTKSVLNSGGTRRERQLEEKRKEERAALKARKKAEKDEQDALFGAALLNIQKKTTTSKKEGKNEAKGRDADDEGTKKGTSRAMKMMFQMDAQEMEAKLKEDPNYIPTLEDHIEAERQKKVAELKANGKGTPVTPESFATWMEKKRKQREVEAKKAVEVELRKKKGGKGLSVLSGRDLFNYKKELFEVDDSTEENGNMENAGQSIEEQTGTAVDEVVSKVESNLFLEGDDEDLDDLDDD